MKFPELADIVGSQNVFEDADIDERYKVDPIGSYRNEPLCVVRPRSTKEVVSIMKYANANRIAVVPSGGNTGFSGGTSADGAIKLSLENMNKIHEIDPQSMTMTVDAGVVLQVAHEAAEAQDLFLPLDLGSRGSAMIGGTIATNAGGNRVLRWGMARDMVLGLEVVLPDGTVVSSMVKMIKDNAGYNWKHLFIGAEGTLGVITKAVLRLRPKPVSSQTAMLAFDDFSQALITLRRLEGQLGGQLSSFEAMWNNFYNVVTTVNLPKRQRPLPTNYGLYCLIENLGSNPDADAAALRGALAQLIEEGIVKDAVVAKSERERADLWAVREDLMGLLGMWNGYSGFDISMSQSDMPRFNAQSEANIRAVYPDATILYYGHVGDGNMHILATPNSDDPDFHHKIDVAVFTALREVGGSVSGEHGIGLMKHEFLSWTRSESEVDLMRRIKNLLDPNAIMNPGKVL